MDIVPLVDLSEPRELTADIVDHYREHGHTLVPQLATSTELEPYAEAIVRTSHAFNEEDRALEERDTYAKAFLQTMNLWRHDPTVARFVLSRRFASVAAQLLGVPRVRLFHDQALFKEPGGGYTPWHQDANFFPLDGHQALTMWMPLVDLTLDMGLLTFAQGSHKAGRLFDTGISDASEELFASLDLDTRFPPSQPVPMRAGDATFHSGWTVHKAARNASDRMRSVMTVIWFADGLEIQTPQNDAQQWDLDTFLPGQRPGELAAGEINPLV